MDSNSLRESLMALARNHHWAWAAPVREVFDTLPGSSPQRHPAQVVSSLDEPQLDALCADGAFIDRVCRHVAELSELLADQAPTPDIAYFSPEFGISDLVPQYSGGLGVLAGDHLKAASDLRLSLGAVGLFYHHGFFRQEVDRGAQTEHFETYDARDLGCVDTGVEVTIPIADHEVAARVWRLDVGRVQLLLLDTDLPGNDSGDRAITDRLYSDDRRHRLQQEIVLGVGGVRAMRRLGWAPAVHHLNEGHAGSLILELLDDRIREGHSLASALDAIRPGLVFTTHTPVPAGIERFDVELAAEHLTPFSQRWGLDVGDLLELGTKRDDRSSFNLAYFCLRAAGRANGVSKLHGEVSRTLFADVPGGTEITSVTNGVHARTWVAPRLQEVLDGNLGTGWADGDADSWQRVDQIDDRTVRAVRRSGACELQAMVADRTGADIDPDALIIGFARRFTAYKRATLLLKHPERLASLLADDDRPMQFVFAGKAHPADSVGKALITDIVAFGAAAGNGRFLFVPGYDMAVARAMYAGCDVWLNTPVRSREASGTSGEKSALNGGLNCSVSDGWWDEMADGRNGWTIPATDGADGDDEAVVLARDHTESAATLDLLAHDIVPEFFADGGPWSAAWIDRIRHGWRTLGPRVTAGRMVSDYSDRLYNPAIEDGNRL